jgi:membrane protease subunit HflK
MRQRLYIETIESILTHARKIVVDTRGGAGGSVIYLPLDKLIEAGARVPAAAGGAAATAPQAPAGAAAGAAAAPAAADARARERTRELR